MSTVRLQERPARAHSSPCGTPAAYQQHIYWGETPCDACYAANNAYHRDGCGTYKKAMHHYRHGEPLDEPCRLARNHYRMTHHRKKARR